MADRKLTPSDEFVNALTKGAHLFQVSLDAETTARLADYYELVMAWNGRLHLVAPCAPAEFATRHVLESLLALPYLEAGARVVDVGSGAGLPVIPCLVAEPGLDATLYEASPKKAVFLREALARLGRRARVVAERFERAAPPRAGALTCRALDRFTELFPRLAAWSAGIDVWLLFGGPTLAAEIERAGLARESVHVPETAQRYLYVVRRRAADAET